jgi:DNA modification methylase
VTELVWKGKYRDGQRVLPDRAPRLVLTEELAETPAPAGADLADGPAGWHSRLISGDTRDVLPALLPEFAGRVRLVYMDPPFATGADHTISITLPHDGTTENAPRRIERVAYRDTWEPGLDGYLQWFCETATLLRDLLTDDGALIVHCDWRLDASLRLILDEVFGAGNFRNAIAWGYRSGGASRREALARKHDTLLLYARSPRFAIRSQIERQHLRKPFIGSRRDASGHYYVDTLLRDVLDGEVTLVRDGQLVHRSLRPVLNVSRERLGYPTQKPIGLIELLIEIASDPGDLVLDCCCGSGTTPAAAALLGRRWIAADASPFALAATRARLLALPAARPFAVQRMPPAARTAAAAPVERPSRTLRVTVSRPVTAPPASPSGYPVVLSVDDLTLPDSDLADSGVLPGGISGRAWIAYWLVDWEYTGDIFHIHDWSGSPRGAVPAPMASEHVYPRPGRRTIAVRAIDLLGGVTTATLDVDL